VSNEPLWREEGDTATETRRKVQRPPMYKVLLHNDDFTTQEFVVKILMTIFHHSKELAFEIMMNVHQRGIGVAGLFPYETAEAKVEQVHAEAREHEFPLKCSLEPE
jgi:ATP-dependent Clp protease adaptor protein ClpS